MEQGHFVGMVLLDLQKSFDTVDYGILLMKQSSWPQSRRIQMVSVLFI